MISKQLKEKAKAEKGATEEVEKTTKEKKKERTVTEKTVDTIKMAGKMLGDALFAPLKPLALFARALNSASSGQGIYQKSLQSLGNVLGSVFTPLFLAFSGVVQGVSDWLAQKLLPVLEDFYEVIMTDVISAAMGLEGALNILVKVVKLAAWIVGGLYTAVKSVIKFIYSLIPTVRKDETRGLAESVKTGLRDSLTEFRRQNAPQAQSMGIAEASKRAQLSALNMSPFEQKNLMYLRNISEKADAAAARMNSRPDAAGVLAAGARVGP